MIPKTRQRPASYHGPTSSEDYNSTMDELEFDVTQLYDRMSRFSSELAEARLAANLETARARAMVDRIKRQEQFERDMKARDGDVVTEFFDFRTKDRTYFENPSGSGWSIAQANRLRIDTGYGQVTLPYDRVVQRFYTVDPDSRKVVQVENITATVTSVSEDNAIKIEQTDINNAFNGQNESVWRREVWYPLQSDVDEVTCDVDITVPVALASTSNVLQIHPFPAGLVDVTQVLYSSSNTTPTDDLTETATTAWQGPSLPANEQSWFRAHFMPLTIQRLKLRLRSRNFVERDGFKVFIYGLQEVGLAVVDFDKDDTSLAANAPSNGKAVVVRFDAPTGYNFNTLHGVFTNLDVDPEYLVLAVYTDQALTNKVWDSNSALPQAAAVGLGGTSSTLYVSVGLGYDDANNVAPLLKDLAIRYTVS